jgi:asparaginyl-tRNA synthetase
MLSDFVLIKDLAQHEGKTVTLKGWVYNKRSSGKIRFLLIRDGTGLVQGVLAPGESATDVFETFEQLTQESSVVVTGTIRADARAPEGYEIVVSRLHVVQIAEPYPISPKEHGTGFLMEHRHLWLRSLRQQAVLRVRSEIIKGIRDFLDEQGFILVDAPILTRSAAEGTSTLFQTDYFGEKAYLAQTGQLYMEAAAMALGKVYCFGPTFRAEKSKTRRHLTEFWMMEPEMAYYDLEDNIRLQEELIAAVVLRVLERRGKELASLERDLTCLKKVSPPFPRLTYDDAITYLQGKGLAIKSGDDFGADEETILAERFDKPVFVTHFPARVKAFYMKRDPGRREVALASDLLAPEGYGEIIGGSQREDDLEMLRERIREEGLPEEDYGWYLDLRRYGSVPHSGFGIGLERTVCWICGLPHIRESIPFPRMLEKIYP